ncbi:hypothetical protein SKAU_G00081870 [Synaphobranchus kaupii]|uniref:Uncharacterized protein n=1 Tax=Synaphobranchus kaupii TaxID=118154 RepID=A0A9Q1FVH7_SYNKA|nr:hypothetical protein SKAU_G00081870 [Synaphobranchus kaupii]
MRRTVLPSLSRGAPEPRVALPLRVELGVRGDRNDFTSYPTADHAPLAPPSEELTSPALSSDTGSPVHPSHFQAPAYTPEDLPVPPDFELRESSVASSGLGVWAVRRLERGERLGPCEGEHQAKLREQTHGWECGCGEAGRRLSGGVNGAEGIRPRAGLGPARHRRHGRVSPGLCDAESQKTAGGAPMPYSRPSAVAPGHQRTRARWSCRVID